MPDDDMETDPNRIRQYPESHVGPYVVIIREHSTIKLNPMKISLILHKKYKSITQCEKLRGKLKITLTDRKEANLVPNDEDLKGFRVFIPARDVEVCGLIHLPDESDFNDIIKYGSGKFSHPDIPTIPILDATRLTKRLKPNEPDSALENTAFIKLCFPGKVLPKSALIHNLLIPIRPMSERPMFCDNCQKFNHTSKYCNVKPVCAKCLRGHKTSECTQNALAVGTCPYCLQAHSEGVKECSFFLQANKNYAELQKRQQRISYSSVLASLQNPAPNPTPTSQEPVVDQFPELRPSSLSQQSSSSGNGQPLLPANPAHSIFVISQHHPNSSASTSAEQGPSIVQLPDTSQNQQQKTLPFKIPFAPRPTARSQSRSNKRKRTHLETTDRTNASTPRIPSAARSRTRPAASTSTPPGFRNSGSSTFKDIVIQICQSLGLSEMVIQLIKSVVLPFIEGIINKYLPLLTSLSKSALTTNNLQNV